MTLAEQIKALPSIKDEAGSECVSREVVLEIVAGAREAIVKEIVALLEHEHGWKLQVPAGDLEPPIKGCWCGFKCDGLDEFNEHLLTVARAAMTKAITCTCEGFKLNHFCALHGPPPSAR